MEAMSKAYKPMYVNSRPPERDEIKIGIEFSVYDKNVYTLTHINIK